MRPVQWKSIGAACVGLICLFLSGSVTHSELPAAPHAHCSGSALREDEKVMHTGSSADERDSPMILLVNKDAASPSEKVCVLPRNARLLPARLLPTPCSFFSSTVGNVPSFGHASVFFKL